MNNKHFSWNKEINNNFIIASRAYFLHKYETLKKVVADANEKAAAEQALREKHEAKVIAAEREL